MASSSSRGPRCRERSRRGRAGRGSVPRGRSRSRSPVRDGESRAFRELSPLRDPDSLGHSEDRGESTKSQLKTTQKPKDQNDPCGANGQALVGTEAQGEPSVTSENGSVPPRKAPGKRGRKPKAEMLLLKLSQDLECPTPQPLCLQKVLGSNEADDGPETPPGGRPKRRAAKVALLYLQQLAEELSSVCQPPAPTEGAQEPAPELERVQKKRRGRRKKEKEETDSDDPAGDADFVPSKEVLLQAEEEEGSDAPLSEVSEPELEVLRGQGGKTSPTGRSKPLCRGLAPNGFHNSIMAPVEKCSSLTCSLRDQQHSQWEFPDWIPLAHKWTCLSDSEAAPYLPAEEKSPLFSIQREGIEDNGVLYRVNRFNSLQPHAERLDVSFFVGGPVWAMEWCPSPEGSAAAQYVAIYCHGSMEETHSVAGLHGGPMLLQLWGLGTLQQEQGSTDKAALAYAIATDHGCVWDMKFCPSGAWEPPDAARQHPQMSRLGLLAVAFSDGKVVLYALPHPGALHRAKRAQVKDGPFHKHVICKVQCIATLQVGSIQAGNVSECGQCFSLSWMPSKPHHHLAAGFYDGTVAIWNLLTKSLLQCMRQPDGSLKLYPFRCFPAHDHAVRSIEWCKADRERPQDQVLGPAAALRAHQQHQAVPQHRGGLAAALQRRHGGPGQLLCLLRALRDPLHRRRVLGLQGIFCGPSQGDRVEYFWLGLAEHGGCRGHHWRAGGCGVARPGRQPPQCQALLGPQISGLQSRPAALQPRGAGGCRAGAAQDQALQRDGHQELHQVSGHRPAQLQEPAQPGAHAQDAPAGGDGGAQPRPPAAGVPAQGALQPQPGLAGLAGVGGAGGHSAGALLGGTVLWRGPRAAPGAPGPLQRPARG
ncbi:general transcription factor 3C polypeptide 2 isoform X6 [Columba livia]|uniref:general transcription factor 3C polypeptide 2 isoform X6 n=1 Tax=Columba livia TaxID=8932 RepID=UPI0031BA0A87